MRKLAAILVADVVGYSRLANADKERIPWGLSRDSIIALHRGRTVKLTGGALVEFRGVVDAVRCAIEMKNGQCLRAPREDTASEQRER